MPKHKVKKKLKRQVDKPPKKFNNTLMTNPWQYFSAIKDNERGIMEQYGLKTRKELKKFLKKVKRDKMESEK